MNGGKPSPSGGYLRRLLSRLSGIRARSRREEEALTLPPMSRGMRLFSMVVVFLVAVLLTWLVVANPLGLGFLPEREAPPALEEAANTIYQCPMHPQVVQDEPGKCPICGMDLVKKEARAGKGSQGEKPVYQCPMHPQVVQDEPGKCPICGMDLVEVKGVSEKPHERKILYWYAPMDPTYIRNEPGLSPMGMKLVPKYADEEEGTEEGVVRIDPVQVQNMGVVTSPAEVADIARHGRTVGILDFDAGRIAWVNTKFEGWIEKVHVNYVGQKVRKGEPLFEIYSPALVTTEEEYIRALEYRAALEESGRPETIRQAESLVRSTRERLAYWDISDEQIEELEANRHVQRTLVVTSPATGVVAEVMNEALEGMFVKPGMDLYKIADLSTVWVHADVYEMDIPWIRIGQKAEVSFLTSPEEKYDGRVLFLYPQVDRDTRTMKICVEVPNPDWRLRPGMYAAVVVQGPIVADAVVIPQTAVIRTGERDIVFVARGEGRFEPREVTLGVSGEGDRIQVVRGVAAGEKVVTQAQFMLDSESRIQEAIAKFRERVH